MLKRSEVEEKYKWDLSSYFTSDAEWKKELENIKPLYNKLTTYEGKLNNKTILLECLNLEKEISERRGRLYLYASLRVKEDGKNKIYQDMLNKFNKYISDVAPTISYISSEVNEFANEYLNELIEDKNFSDFDLFFKEVIRNKSHMLSKQEEKLLAKVSECIGGEEQTFDMLDAVDIRFDNVKDKNGKELPLNNANYATYIISCDRHLRESAFKNLNGGYGKYNYTIASNYMNSVSVDCTMAKVRNFGSAFEAALFYENVDSDVYLSLINGVNNSLKSFYKYFDLKQKTLNLPDFYTYDVSTKLNAGVVSKFTYDKAFDMVTNALKCLGEDYIETLNKAKKERWIDVMPNENKDTGAFSWGAYGANPMVSLNFEDSIKSVFTLAHELGHMMHTYYSHNNLPSTKAGYEIFVAEVASTVNEMLLIKKLLLEAKDKNEKLYYMDHLMNTIYATIYRQTMFAEFEYNAHKAYENSEDTTAEALNDMYLTLCKKYFGEKVKLAEEIKYEWSRIPHFYSAFYVYKYATGLISALSISNKILSGEKNAVKNYKEFLKSGASKPPVELLKIAGVDLTNPKSFTDAFDFVEQILTDWENLLN